MKQLSQPTEKQPYEAPQIVDLGSVGQITQGNLPGHGSCIVINAE